MNNNLEIVICDDASTDGTAHIVQDYAHKYPKEIKPIFNEHNLGITPAFNVILNQCTGKYIAFFSGDDVFLPGKICKQVEVMENDSSVVLSYHDIEVFLSKTNETLRHWHHGPLSTPAMSGNANELVRKVVAHGALIPAMSVMVRRDAIPPTGFDERIPIASDWFMWIEILARAGVDKKVVCLPDVLARYRRHDSNVTNSQWLDDWLVTLALTEAKYPWLIDEIRLNRAKVHYRRGIKLIRNGDPQVGRRFLLSSLRNRWKSWRWFRWFAASYIPRLRLPLRRRTEGSTAKPGNR